MKHSTVPTKRLADPMIDSTGAVCWNVLSTSSPFGARGQAYMTSNWPGIVRCSGQGPCGRCLFLPEAIPKSFTPPNPTHPRSWDHEFYSAEGEIWEAHHSIHCNFWHVSVVPLTDKLIKHYLPGSQGSLWVLKDMAVNKADRSPWLLRVYSLLNKKTLIQYLLYARYNFIWHIFIFSHFYI